MTLSKYSKLIAALVGAAAQAVTLGLVPAPADHYLAVVVAALTALGVYAAPPNKPNTGA